MATRKLASWIRSFQFPGSTLAETGGAAHQGKRMFMNTLSVALSGSCAREFTPLVKWAEREGCTPRATIVGKQLKTSPSAAALLNGFTCHLQDYDDTHLVALVHPTAPVFPAVLAAAELVDATQAELLEAFIIGTEVVNRISISVDTSHYDSGYHITGTAGVFGAVAGAAKLLKLDENQMVHAIGIAGTQSSGLREVFGSDCKPLHPAVAARNGLQAAELALDGFTAVEDFIGGRRGFWSVMSPKGHSEENLLSDLGTHWEIMNVGLKPFANCLMAQPIQDGVIQLRNKHSINSKDVKSISILCNEYVPELIGHYPNPTSGLQGKFSYHHCAAAALVDGAGHDAQFADDRMNDPEIARIRSLVTAEVDESISGDACQVTISLNDGETFNISIEHAIGSSDNPMTDEQLNQKFEHLVRPVLNDKTEELRSAVWGMHRNTNAKELSALMIPA